MARVHRSLLKVAQGQQAPSDEDGGDIGLNTTPMDLWVGSRVQFARQNKGWSRMRLAEALGLRGKRRIEKWESGENRMTAAHIQAVAKVFDIHPGWFFDDFPEAGAIPGNRGEAMQAMLDMPEAIPVIKAISELPKEQRAAVLTMVRSMAAAGVRPTE